MDNTKELKRVELQPKEFVEFTWMDTTHGEKSLGWAYFQICPIYKRGRIDEVYIYPRQQHTKCYWHISNIAPDSAFCLTSYDDMDDPNVTEIAWCKDHKTTTLIMRVPKNSKYFYVDHHGISFLKHKWGDE